MQRKSDPIWIATPNILENDDKGDVIMIKTNYKKRKQKSSEATTPPTLLTRIQELHGLFETITKGKHNSFFAPPISPASARYGIDPMTEEEKRYSY